MHASRWELTSCRVQPPATPVTFEVFRLLMGNKELQIFEISLACSLLASDQCARPYWEAHSSSTMAATAAPPRLDANASFCPSCRPFNERHVYGWDILYEPGERCEGGR